MRILSALLASSALMSAVPVAAQSGAIVPSQTPDEASDKDASDQAGEQSVINDRTAPEGTLDVIVVTAQKRSQNLQDVPVAVTAISADALVNRNVATVSDLPRLAPSLTVTQGNVPTNNSINLRGIGTIAFSTAIEPSVAVIVDDVALLQQAQAFSGLSDVARIEVLRGPQGTLFGKNASAGALNIVSEGPTRYLTGAVTGTVTTDEQYRIDGVVSGPIGDSVGFRLNGFYGDRAGYIDNVYDGRRLNNDKSYGVRGRLAIEPSPIVEIDLTGTYSVSESDGTARTYRTVPAGSAIYGSPLSNTLVGITPGEDNFDTAFDGPLFNKSKSALVSGRVTVDLGSVDLVSITSYQDWRFRFIEDFDYIVGTVIGLPNGIVAESSYMASQFAQELRLASNGGGPVNYVAGLFYANGETDRTFDRGPSGPAVAQWNSSNGTKSYAAFGQVSFDLAQSTHVDVGLRANHEKIDVTYINNVAPAVPPANNARCNSLCVGEASDSVVTGKIALRQDLSDGVMAYASYSTGYKGQGYDISTGFTPARAADPVKPETSDAYELGLKSRFLDNRVQLNVAAFWTDFSNFQAQSGVQLPDGTIQLQLNNVGSVRTRGIEVELEARPIEALRIDGGISYTDAKILKFPNAQCYTGQTEAEGCLPVAGSPTGLQDLAGERLSNAPEWKFNLGAKYDIYMPSMPFDAFVQADVNYQSDVSYSLLANPLLVQDAYALVNASIGIDQNERGGMRIALFVSNLFDKSYASALGTPAGGSAGLVAQTLPRDARRYAGIRARFSF
ncbi:TonB-dependent receptor [Qipengyuania sp. GH1]|uniref:TonB-dependent receptor n=1 Tax=Qipengyuania aestuarii TaxID=2867241 RepID=UPI001C88C3E8|nr:TonB-dependent receptor [Qipengyuania aestuarii]MBX7535020.1 TonB-dependent receptor [Qipengyuania aestuarii]